MGLKEKFQTTEKSELVPKTLKRRNLMKTHLKAIGFITHKLLLSKPKILN